MTEPIGPLPDSRRQRGKILLVAVIRVVLGLTSIGLVLYLIPDTAGGLFLGPFSIGFLAVLLYFLYVRHQIRGIKKAPYPTLRAAEALILVAAMFLALYASMYVVISHYDPQSFSEQLNDFSAYYFALTVLATVGFGDITPVTVLARAVAMTQMALDIAFIGVAVRLLGGAAQQALQARTRRGPEQEQA